MRQTYRFRSITAPATPYDDLTTGENPPCGADINYFLKSAPTGTVAITIQDSKGADPPHAAGTEERRPQPRSTGTCAIRRQSASRIGRRPLSRRRFASVRTAFVRARAGSAAAAAGSAIMQPPGTYTVKLSVGGRDYTQQLRVLKDPHSAGTEADIAAQQTMLTALRRDLDEAVDAVNSAELVRAQIVNLKNLTQDTELRRAADELDQKLTAVEGTLVELRATGRGQDGVRFGSKLVQSSAIWRTVSPTATTSRRISRWPFTRICRIASSAPQGGLSEVFNRELAAFNDMLRRANLPGVVTQTTRRPSNP